MRYHHFLIAALVGGAPSLAAQSVSFSGPEIRPLIGVYMPIGGLNSQLKPAATLGAQYAYEMAHNFHVLASVGWTHGHSRLPSLSEDLVRIWQYDAGAEVNRVRKIGATWMFRPFVGAGVGGRTYDYKADGVVRNYCAAGYASTGAELQRVLLAWRLEARGYLTCYRSPVTEKTRVGNDFALSLGAVWHLR